jgi:Rieske Fe-S protein
MKKNYLIDSRKNFNEHRREFLIASAKTGCSLLCGAMLANVFPGCDTIEEGEPVLDLTKYSELQKPGGAIKKRYQKLNNANPIIIIRLDENTFTAYSAICTHQAVEVLLPENGEIRCPNHDSRFRITNGEVIQGEAIDPLPKFIVQFDTKTNILRIG